MDGLIFDAIVFIALTVLSVMMVVVWRRMAHGSTTRTSAIDDQLSKLSREIAVERQRAESNLKTINALVTWTDQAPEYFVLRGELPGARTRSREAGERGALAETASNRDDFLAQYSGSRKNESRSRDLQATRIAPTPQVRDEQAKTIVEKYCRRELSREQLLVGASDLRLTWGAVDINAVPPRFERERASEVFGILTSENVDMLVVVGEDCAYSMGLSYFFDRVNAQSGQRVFCTRPAEAVLLADGTIESRSRGRLELRG